MRISVHKVNLQRPKHSAYSHCFIKPSTSCLAFRIRNPSKLRHGGLQHPEPCTACPFVALAVTVLVAQWHRCRLVGWHAHTAEAVMQAGHRHLHQRVWRSHCGRERAVRRTRIQPEGTWFSKRCCSPCLPLNDFSSALKRPLQLEMQNALNSQIPRGRNATTLLSVSKVNSRCDPPQNTLESHHWIPKWGWYTIKRRKGRCPTFP